jgi:hypothetical protein
LLSGTRSGWPRSRSTRIVWTGEGSHTLEQRRKKLPEFLAKNRRPIDRAFVHSIFERDHPGTADEARRQRLRRCDPDAGRLDAHRHLCGHVLEAAADRPAQAHWCRRSILRGQYDGIAALDDLLAYYRLLPNMNKQFSVMRGISHASFQQKNYMMVYHLLHSFYTMPDPIYTGEHA